MTYLAWLGGMSAKWMPRTDPRFDTDVLPCLQVEWVPDRLGETVEPVPLEEHASVIGALDRGDLVRVGDCQLADLHPASLTKATHR